MKERLLAACLSVLAAVPLTAQQRVLPLGDSITESTTGYASYRYYLWQLLDAQLRCVDFLGYNVGVGGGGPLHEDFDQQHSGYSGMRATTMAAVLQGTPLPLLATDIVLLHIGSNDIIQPLLAAPGSDVVVDLPAAEVAVRSIITRLRAANPAVKVALAQIFPIPAAAHPAAPRYVTTWNTVHLPAVVASMGGGGAIQLVNQFAGFSYPADYRDLVHPNDSGEQGIANNWSAALLASGWLPQSVPCLAVLSPGCVQPNSGLTPPLLTVPTGIPSTSPGGMTLQVTQLPPTAQVAAAAIGFTKAGSPPLLGACPLYPSIDSQVSLPITAGVAANSVPLPNGLPPGIHLYIQAAVAASAPLENAISNGVQMMIF